MHVHACACMQPFVISEVMILQQFSLNIVPSSIASAQLLLLER